jgi:hypothetical protein
VTTDSLARCPLFFTGAKGAESVGLLEGRDGDRMLIGSAKRLGTRYDGKSPGGNHRSSS